MSYPVWLEGDGFIDADGRYWPEQMVRDGLRKVADWWGSLTEDQRTVVCQLAHFAWVDQEIDDAVFGNGGPRV